VSPVNENVEELVDIPDTMIIDQNMVVLWWPDSIQQIEMKEKFDETSYNKFVDDLTWYSEKAVEMLDSAHINNKITDRDVIIFKNKIKGTIEVKRKETNGNMVLFNVNKDPFVTNMTSFDRKEVISFFK
jgi:hypothetical protein